MSLCYTEPYLLSLCPAYEMNVVWLIRGEYEGYVEYGDSPQLLRQRAAAERFEIEGFRAAAGGEGYAAEEKENPPVAVWQLIAKISGRPAGKTYYRIVTRCGETEERSEIFDFDTPAPDGCASFLLLSDLQLNPPCEDTVRRAGREACDFMLYAGDFVFWNAHISEWFSYPDGYNDPAHAGRQFFTAMQQRDGGCRLMQYRPFFPCPGNHDVDDYAATGYGRETAREEKNWTWRLYMQLFRPLYPTSDYGAGGRRWYFADYGRVHIVSLSVQRWAAWGAYEAPGWTYYDSVAEGSPQLLWLENDLGACENRYKWVIMHWHMMNKGNDVQVPFCRPVLDRLYPGSVEYPSCDCEAQLRPLFERFGVNGVSFGHSHVYERYEVNGVHYIEAAFLGKCCRAAGREAPLHPTGHAPVVEQNRLRSFMIVTAGERLTARAILAEGGEAGKVFDAFELVSEAAGQRSRQVYAR